jgi:hypothetical protein
MCGRIQGWCYNYATRQPPKAETLEGHTDEHEITGVHRVTVSHKNSPIQLLYCPHLCHRLFYVNMTSFELKRKRDFAGDLDNNRQMRIGMNVRFVDIGV